MLDGILVAGGEVWSARGWTRADVLIREGRIAKVGRTSPRRPPFGCVVVDAAGAKVLPGLIDLQINGGFGTGFSTATVEEIESVAVRLAGFGVTSLLPTLTSLSARGTVEALGRIREAAARTGGTSILGAHLEGPFLNPGRAGAHRAQNILPPNLVEFTKFLTAGQGIARMVTIAPEMRGAVSLIAAGVRRGVAMAIGHTAAGAAEVEQAVRAGASVVTHLFNAMAAFHHREDGVTASALADDRLKCTCIYDRQHISRTAMTIALRCKPAGSLALVSDATAALGRPDGAVEADGVKLVSKGGRVTLKDSGRLAGGGASLLGCVRNVAEDFQRPLEEAWALGSEAPARILGLERTKGQVAAGFDGDLVVLEDRWHIRTAIVQGRIAHGDHHQG